MRLPRFLWVPFELGRPFGAPHQPDFQRRVLHEALALFERTDGPVVLAEFPDDAPVDDGDDVPWACPVSYAPAAAEEPDLRSAIRVEMASLAPWAELSPAPAANIGIGLDEKVGRLAAIAGGASGQPIDIEEVRLIADDLRTWYLHAAT